MILGYRRMRVEWRWSEWVSEWERKREKRDEIGRESLLQFFEQYCWFVRSFNNIDPNSEDLPAMHLFIYYRIWSILMYMRYHSTDTLAVIVPKTHKKAYIYVHINLVCISWKDFFCHILFLHNLGVLMRILLLKLCLYCLSLIYYSVLYTCI